MKSSAIFVIADVVGKSPEIIHELIMTFLIQPFLYAKNDIANIKLQKLS